MIKLDTFSFIMILYKKIHHIFRAVFGAEKIKKGFGTAVMAISKPVLPHFMRFCLYFALKIKKKRLLPW